VTAHDLHPRAVTGTTASQTETTSERHERYAPVTWAYLARLDEVPCDIFVRTGRKAVLYATTGASPDSLRERASRGVPLVVREEDAPILRRMLTVSLDRALADEALTPAQRSREAYSIAASIVAQTFKPKAAFEADEASLVQETIDLLTRVLAQEDDTLWSMVASMQRHQVTHSHAMSTAIYALALARLVGIGDWEQLRDVGRGAILADIGLTTLPARVVDNAGHLDPKEEKAYRQHPTVGFAIVTRALGETPPYAHIIIEHHERADGSGYPTGRKGSQVALDSQVVGIADHYDMLTADRDQQQEQQPLSPFEACQKMRFARPGQFDDAIMRSFIEMLGGWAKLRVEVA
jgi:putative nucleotidyltransferase with HDIG domain